MPYFIYIIECANGQFYTGWSTDPLRRLKQHNKGKGARYTRMNGPCRLVYAEEMSDLSTTLKREIRVKRLGHPQKARLIEDANLNCLSLLLAGELNSSVPSLENELLNSTGADDQQDDPKNDQSQHP